MNRFLAVSLFAVACVATSPDGEPTPEPAGSGCEPVSRTVLGADDVSPAGFSARAALDAAVGVHEAAIAWADGSDDVLTVEVAQAGDIAFVDYEVVTNGTGPAIEIACADGLEIGATVAITSAGGSLELRAPIAVWADVDGGFATFDPAGAVDLLAFVPAGAQYDEVRAWGNLRFDAAGVTGSIDGQGSAVDGDVAFAEGFDVATIGSAAE